MEATTNNTGLADMRHDMEKDGIEKELKAGAGRKQKSRARKRIMPQGAKKWEGNLEFCRAGGVIGAKRGSEEVTRKGEPPLRSLRVGR